MSHRILTCLVGASALAVSLVVTDVNTIEARGDGGRSGGNRPAASRPSGHSPAMSHPANMPRPGGGNAQRPGGGNAPRPGGGNVQRPGGGNAQRPGGDGPSKPGGFQRPSTLPSHAAGNRPSGPGKKDFPGGIGKKDFPSNPGKKDFPGGIGKGDLPGIGKKDFPNVPGKKDLPGIGKKDFPNAPAKKDFPNFPGGRPTGDQLNDFLGGGGFRPKDGDRPANVVNGDVNIGNKTNDVKYAENKQAWVDNRHATGDAVRNNSGNRYWAAYSSGAYYHHGGGYNYRRGWQSGYAWAAATAVTLGAFLGPTYAAAPPVYYAYGDGGNVHYEDNSVYVNNQPAGTAEEYYDQAKRLAAAAPEKVADTDEWLPLGTFALSREDVEDSQMMVELAVNKKGVVAGTYYNEATDVSRPLKGTMDVKTQRTAITFADGKNAEVVLETGVANLTKDEAPALLHKGKDVSDPVLLVRLKKPAGEK